MEKLCKLGKAMVLWKKKLWKNYDTIPKTMELWFTFEKLWYYVKENFGTIVNSSLL